MGIGHTYTVLKERIIIFKKENKNLYLNSTVVVLPNNYRHINQKLLIENHFSAHNVYNTVDLGYYKCILELKLGWVIQVMFCWGKVGLTQFIQYPSMT